LFTGSKVWSVRLLDGSGVNREVHAPFCEGLGVRFPRPTHHETFNTLKNQGYGLEHNYGHGQQYLATVFATLMMLAFLVDQVQELSCRLFQAARDRFHARTALWERLRALVTDFYIPDWKTLWQVLAIGHAATLLTSRAPDTS
jgi:hypothetical protein